MNVPHWSQYQSPWTPIWLEQVLEGEIGDRALSWAHDVNPYEFNDEEDILAMIPGAS